MRPHAFKLFSIILLSVILFSCSNEDDGIYFNETTEVINVENVSYSKIENEILNLVNEYRLSKGLSTLSLLNVISSVSEGHTDYMIKKGTVSHDNFNQRTEYLINNANAKSVAENVAYGYNSAQAVVNGWLNSDAHRKIIESEVYTHFGISTESNNEGRNYFTQIFIKK